MKEPALRRLHRWLGLLLVLFILLQVGSGLLLTLWQSPVYGLPIGSGAWFAVARLLHSGGGLIGVWYRLILSAGLVILAGTGLLIGWKIWQRSRTGPARTPSADPKPAAPKTTSPDSPI